MRNARMIRRAVSVVVLGLALLVTAQAQANAQSGGMVCIVCNWETCPSIAGQNRACQLICGVNTSTLGCGSTPCASGQDKSWQCALQPATPG